jgi:hypothetical protein
MAGELIYKLFVVVLGMTPVAIIAVALFSK